MKFRFNVFGRTVLATAEQLEGIYSLVRECPVLNDKYVGNGKGTNGGAYVQLLQEFPTMDMAVTGVSDAEVAAMELVTKLHTEQGQG